MESQCLHTVQETVCWNCNQMEIAALKAKVAELKKELKIQDEANDILTFKVEALKKSPATTEQAKLIEKYEKALDALMSDKHNCECFGDDILEPRFVCGGHQLLAETKAGE